MDKEYKIVGIERRQSNRSPIVEALMSGRTLLMPHGTAFSGYGTTLKRNGYRLHSHQASDGVVLWADPPEKSDGHY